MLSIAKQVDHHEILILPDILFVNCYDISHSWYSLPLE